MKKWLGSLLLLTAAVIWGGAFVAQSVGMDYIGPFTFNCVRYFVGSAVLIPFVFLFRNKKEQSERKANPTKRKQYYKYTILGGCACGLFMYVASMLQQFGIKYTTVGKAGFITSLYIIIVPILGIFLKKKTKPLIWVCVAVAAVGLYLLCATGGFALQLGDSLVLLCAIFFACHILLVDFLITNANGVGISCIQFFVSGVLCCISMFIFEKPMWSGIVSAAVPILYTGVLSSGVAYTFQILGQKSVEPTKASLILCLESVAATLFGWLILKQTLSLRESIGCLVVFAAIILAQFSTPKTSIQNV